MNVRSAAYAYGSVYGFTDSGNFFIAPFDDITNVTYFPCPFEEDWWITALTFDYTRGCLIGLCAGDHDYSIAAFSPNDGTVLGSAVIQSEQEELTLYGICADEEGTPS